jgi:hypothetical protein
MRHDLRNLHDALVTYLAGSKLKNRFTVGFNPETSRWVISRYLRSGGHFKGSRLILNCTATARANSRA